MSFRINTNITSLNSNNNTERTNKKLTASLEHLSSGLRINKAADDASGMTVADSLRSQANSLEQSIASGNDAIGVLQTADYAMAEQIEIIDTIRVKAIQAANDFHTRDSRLAIQADIIRLLEEFDNIANTTSFNDHKLLNGNFSNKHFQIGAYSNQTIDISIGNTRSETLGHITYNTTTPFIYQNLNNFETSEWTFRLQYGSISHDYIEFDFSGKDMLEKGLNYIVDKLNPFATETGMRIKANTEIMPSVPILGSAWGGPISLELNGVSILNNATIQQGDTDNLLINSINSRTSLTGITASNDGGVLHLISANGLPIHINGNNVSMLGFGMDDGTGTNLDEAVILGELTFSKQGSTKPTYSITAKNADAQAQKGVWVDGMSQGANTRFEDNVNISFGTTNLHDFLSNKIDAGLSKSMGFGLVGRQGVEREGGVLSYEGSQILIDIAVAALGDLDKVRSDIGSIQNQITAAINNISVTHLNIKAAESQIRDVDFASEVAEFNKQNILAQSGSYASAQANQIQQAIIRLLQ